jgi:hypothetical protein
MAKLVRILANIRPEASVHNSMDVTLAQPIPQSQQSLDTPQIRMLSCKIPDFSNLLVGDFRCLAGFAAGINFF